MRILGFSKKWPKLELNKPIEERLDFSTFRFQRKDKDYQVGENLQAVYKPRSKNREKMGIVEVLSKEPRWVVNMILGNEGIPTVNSEEAQADGFKNAGDMEIYMGDYYGEKRIWEEPMNKLTLKWLES